MIASYKKKLAGRQVLPSNQGLYSLNTAFLSGIEVESVDRRSNNFMIRSVTKTEGNITVFHLKENLDVRKVKAFAKKASELIEAGRIHLVLDLSGVDEICLMGLVAISSLFNKCRQAGGALKVVSLTGRVRRKFRETNLINTIEVFENPVDGIKSFRTKNLLKAHHYSGSFFLEDKQSFVAWDRLSQGAIYN